jgi:hypothetical protein
VEKPVFGEMLGENPCNSKKTESIPEIASYSENPHSSWFIVKSGDEYKNFQPVLMEEIYYGAGNCLRNIDFRLVDQYQGKNP